MNIILLHASNYNYIKTYGPRCLYRVENTTVLDKQIDALNKVFKDTNIFVVTGFKSKKIKYHLKHHKNVFVIENIKYEDTNDLYSLSLGIEYIDNHVLIIQDNIIFKPVLFNKFKTDVSKLFLSHNQKFELGCIVDKTNYINNISWGLKNYWTNMVYIKNHELLLLKELCKNPIIQKWFLVEGLNWIIDNHGQFTIEFINSHITLVNKNNVKI